MKGLSLWLGVIVGEEFRVFTEMLKELPLIFAPSNNFSVVGIAVGKLAPWRVVCFWIAFDSVELKISDTLSYCSVLMEL